MITLYYQLRVLRSFDNLFNQTQFDCSIYLADGLAVQALPIGRLDMGTGAAVTELLGFSVGTHASVLP